MSLAPYRRVFSYPRARQMLLLGLLLRVPIFSTGVLLMLHVTDHLGRSWTEAGVVSALATLAIAISGPWRGRLLDTYGLRRVLIPSIVITGTTWAIAPFVGYWPLLIMVGVAGLFVVPIFSIARQGVIAAVPSGDRRTALSADSVTVELAYMSGPALALLISTQIGTAWTLLMVQMLALLGSVTLWILNPPLREEGDQQAGPVDAPAASVARSSWLGPRFVVLCLAAAATTIVLVGSEVAVVAAVKDWGDEGQLGVIFAAWGLGSILGGVTYGALSRGFSPFLLLAALAVTSVPMAWASSAGAVAVLGLIAGVFCAPTVTASVEAVSRAVPALARGEAMGWHGSSMTMGSAIAAPLAGVAIDHGGYQVAILVVCAVGLAIALGGGSVMLRERRRAQRLALAA
ncbi:MFS transporter [Demetria terragena]|uniref:MFS transporter n=1 Tax=Demetria terragena TaxID=63959 RepID=UPI00036F97A6|nr:MFS transporter [Demetria terragena]